MNLQSTYRPLLQNKSLERDSYNKHKTADILEYLLFLFLYYASNNY